MLNQRRICRITAIPKLAPGFVGPGHLAAPVIQFNDFELTDPCIALMDDHLDIGDRPVGGPCACRVRDHYAAPARKHVRIGRGI
jgi:hypothetical protein